MNYKQKLKNKIFWLVLMCLVACSTVLLIKKNPVQAKEESDIVYNYMQVHFRVDSFSKTRINWKKKNVDQYIIYKVDTKTNKKKKIDTVLGSATGYTIKTKKNKKYSYEIVGVKYNNQGSKKIKTMYRGNVTFYSGVSNLQFNEYNYVDGDTAPNRIELEIQNFDGMKIDGYELYRKEQGKTYKRIKTIKSSKINRYIDKCVAVGKKYTYKIRAYRKINDKKYYGKYSKPMARNAVWRTGKFLLTGEATGENPVLIMKSDSGNGLFECEKSMLLHSGFLSKTEDNIFYQAFAYSYDNTKWNLLASSDGLVRVKPGECLYIKFERKIIKDMAELEDFFYEISEDNWYVSEVRYNDFISYLRISLLEGCGYANINEEMYH